MLDPKVILPRSFYEMSEPCREAVICHEALHVRRRDWVIILGEEIVRAIFWFHPAISWRLSRIHLSREQWIDSEVIRLTGNRQLYLDSLLEIAQRRGCPKSIPAPLFLKERHLVQRVSLILKEASMTRRRLGVSLVAIVGLLGGTIRAASGWFPLTGEPFLDQEKLRQAIPASSDIAHLNPVPYQEQSANSADPGQRREPIGLAAWLKMQS
jgi:beta-lactamase regulating signal transducer with metallopeptidase domain